MLLMEQLAPRRIRLHCQQIDDDDCRPYVIVNLLYQLHIILRICNHPHMMMVGICYTRCSQTRVRPHRASVRPGHGRGLASAPAEDWTRPVVPWYGRVEHHMVLRIPTMDNLETPPPQLGVYVGPFSRVSRLSIEGILRTIWPDFRVLSPVLHTSGCVRVVKHLVNPWMSCVNTYAVRT